MNSLARVVLLLLVFASFLFPCLTWVLSAFDLPVRSLFSDEGLRWLFSNGSAGLVNYPIEVIVLFIISWGALRYVDFFNHPWKFSTPWYASLFFLIFAASLLGYAAFSVHSPLVSITGTIQHSPFLGGLPAVICLIFLFIALIYGVLSSKLKSQTDLMSFFIYGLSHYASWFLCGMLISFLVSCIRFTFRV